MADLETTFGYMDVKSSPVQFYVQKRGDERNDEGRSRANTVFKFELELINVGRAMNINTGVFTAPRSGTYHFSFSFINFGNVSFCMRKNGVPIGVANTYATPYVTHQSSIPATLKLKSGDTVDLFQIRGGNIYDDGSHYTHFTGWLIEEDLEETAISAPTVKKAPCQVKGFAKTCQDLRCRGHTADGFYLVRSVTLDTKIETIYCEFSDSTSSGGNYFFRLTENNAETNLRTTDLETRFGYMDVKWSPVHFYVQRNKAFSSPNSVVTFDLERLNVGGAMNINTGVFTAPRSGTYFFSFAFMKDEQTKYIYIYIRKNGANIGAANTHALPNTKLQSNLPVMLKLKSGDKVDLIGTRGGNIYDDASHYTHFTGWLIEEDIEIPN